MSSRVKLLFIVIIIFFFFIGWIRKYKRTYTPHGERIIKKLLQNLIWKKKKIYHIFLYVFFSLLYDKKKNAIRENLCALEVI